MCLIFLAIDEHPDYPLIVAANRDEFYARETLPAHRWDNPAGMIAGKDVQGGGTWLGVDEEHGIAMLTNYRDPSNIREDAPTRGHLVTGYFNQRESPGVYLSEVERTGNEYNGFNLICGNKEGYFYYGNYAEGVRQLTKGIHGLSNALIDDPWPKVESGKKAFRELIHGGSPDPEAFIGMMFNDKEAPDNELPSTGVTLELERVLSPMFIKSKNYGSRCTTVIMVNKSGNVRMVERTYAVPGLNFADRAFALLW